MVRFVAGTTELPIKLFINSVVSKTFAARAIDRAGCAPFDHFQGLWATRYKLWWTCCREDFIRSNRASKRGMKLA